MGEQGARGVRPGRACARRLGVLASQLGQVGAQCTWLSSDSVFWPGLTRYFPESLNEHCSSKIFSKKKKYFK